MLPTRRNLSGKNVTPFKFARPTEPCVGRRRNEALYPGYITGESINQCPKLVTIMAFITSLLIISPHRNDVCNKIIASSKVFIK